MAREAAPIVETVGVGADEDEGSDTLTAPDHLDAGTLFGGPGGGGWPRGAGPVPRLGDRARSLGWVRGVLLAIGVAYVAVRLQAVLRVHEVWGDMPDSAGYRVPGSSFGWERVSFTGGAQRPWTVPLVYALVPTDGVRAGLQVLVSIGAWATLAAVVARQLVRPWLRIAGVVLVLLISCSWGVISWDLAILSESLALSLAVLMVAAWIGHLGRPSWVTATAVVVTSALFLFTRVHHAPVIAAVAVAALVLAAGRSRPAAPPRAVRVATAASLTVLAAWGLALVGPQDQGYAARDRLETSLFAETFALNLRFHILADEPTTAWFLEHGMPRPVALEPYVRHDGIHEDAWETWPAFFDAFRRDRALVDWVEEHGRRTFTTYTIERSPDLARRFAGDLPALLVPAASSLGYAWPEPILPGPVAAVVAPQAGDATIAPVPLVLAGCVATVAIRRRLPPNRPLAVVGAVAAAVSVPALFLSWLGSPVEHTRHAVPFTVVLLVGLVLVLLAALDRAPGRSPRPAAHGSDPAEPVAFAPPAGGGLPSPLLRP